VRTAALATITTIAEEVPKYIRRSPAMMSQAAEACLQLMCVHTLTDEQWIADTSDLREDDDSKTESGEELIEQGS
jgi:hypothetical protein